MGRHIVLFGIVQEIKTAKFYSILADEVTSHNTEHLALCTRFVDAKGDIREEFMTFLSLERLTGRYIAEKIIEFLKDNDLNVENIRGQGYDGASNMSSERVGVQAQINALVTWHTTGYAEKVEVLVKGFPEVFNDNLGEIHPFKARLVLKEGAQPVFCRPRSVPFAIKEQIETELERLEKTGVICPVKYSEWATPIVPVAKPDRSIRICGDFKITVNSALHVDQYPLPVPEELFATLAGGKQFTKLDLSNAYQQLLLDNDSRKMCTINTHRGLCQYTRLPFGIASAPAIFQKLMDSVLQGMSRTVCYIDDILITGDSEDEHLKNLELVLGRLKTHGIMVRKSKCVFMANSVEFLWHRIDAEGLHPLESKIEAMVKVPPPKNMAELKSFLGMVNYYAKFLPNLSTTISPLYTLLKKNSRWQWTEECSQAFLAAKGMLTSSKVLAHYNPKLSLILATDASSYGVGAVLTQVSEEGTERPITYVSRTLSDAERNYAQIEKEALAIIFGVKRFHVYLYGRKFLLLTDHKPLTTIFGPKTVVAASRLQRWALVLSAYQYDVKFRATEEHGNVDGLSRLPLKGETHEEEETEASIFNMVQIETLPVTAGQLRNESRQDKELSKAIKQSIPLAPMQPWTWPERPWQRVHVDFAGPFLGKMFFLLMDAHSKWPEVYEMTSTTAQKTVDILRHIFAAYGLPEQLVSDNGPQFVAKEFEDFMLKNGIRHIRSAPYHPATNGLVERFVQSFKRAMETGKNSGQTLQHRLSSFLLAYRSSPHSVTNVSPCSLFLQRELRTKLDLLRQTTEQIVRKKQEEQKEGHDKNTRERVFEQNDIVWASNFGVGERWVKGKIKQSSGPSLYLVELADGREWRRHIDHLRRAEGGVRKTEGIKSEIDDQQMMQPDKEVINKEKRAVEPAPEEAGEVQIDQDETPTEVEENEDKTMERKPEVPVARHRLRDSLRGYITAEIEAVLNSRPLSYVSGDDMEEPITPSHLIVGHRILNLPDDLSFVCDLDDDEFTLNAIQVTHRVKHLNNVLNHFWKRWRKEYLSGLREAHAYVARKHSDHGNPHVTVGDIVIVSDDSLPRGQWKLGNCARAPQGNGWYGKGCHSQDSLQKRPIQLLYPLEIRCESTSITQPETTSAPKPAEDATEQVRPKRTAAKKAIEAIRNWVTELDKDD
eukprot:Em0018g780a